MVIGVSLMLCPWIIVLAASPRGFDVTDEAFYLFNLEHPEDLSASVYLFGPALNPLYRLVNGNISGLRALATLIWLAVATGVAWTGLRLLATDTTAFQMEKRVWLTLLLASGASLYYCFWLLTPSYNWLTLVGVAAFWCGYLLWLKSSRPWSKALGAAVFAGAAAMVFWAKPPSAALLVFYPMVGLAVRFRDARRLLDPRVLLGGVVGFGLGIAMPLWSGFPPAKIVESVQRGLELQRLFKPNLYGSELGIALAAVEQIGQIFTKNPYLIIFGMLSLPPLLLTLMLLWTRGRGQRQYRRVTFTLALGLVTTLIAMTLVINQIGDWSLNVTLVIGVYLLIGHYAQRRLKGAVASRHDRWLWLIPIFGLIIVFVFGTDQPYRLNSGMAAYFYLFGVAYLLLSAAPGSINAVLLRCAVPTLLIAIAALTFNFSLHPYRQDVPVWSMDQVITFENGSQSLLVSREMARYLTEMRDLATANGFQAETPFIDLADTPGVGYALGGRAYGFPWMLAGYPGSDAGRLYILQQWRREDLDNAWVLVDEGTSPSFLDSLTQVGLAFPDNYVNVGSAREPNSDQLQTLWRPANDS